MKPIKLSREKFLELFDYNGLYQTYQGNIGDCWLVSAINGMMESPNGRAKIYQMFEQEGNDILVKMSGLKQKNLLQELFSSSKVKPDDYCEYTIRFKDGLIYDGEKTQGLRGAAALQMIEQAFALQRLGRNSFVHKQLNENNITEYAQFTNIDKVLVACDGGDQIEFL